jgi:hypothetical protein
MSDRASETIKVFDAASTSQHQRSQQSESSRNRVVRAPPITRK